MNAPLDIFGQPIAEPPSPNIDAQRSVDIGDRFRLGDGNVYRVVQAFAGKVTFMPDKSKLFGVMLPVDYVRTLERIL